MKKVFGILAVVLSIVSFAIYYPIAVDTYPFVPEIPKKLNYYALYIGLSFAFLALGWNSESKIKNLIYYTGASFWITIFLCYFFKDVGMIKSRDMSIYFLIGTSILCLAMYFYKKPSK